MLIDFRTNITVPDFVVIKVIEVERVEIYYLGVVFDNGLSWKENLKKLRSFDINPQILQRFFVSSTSIVFTFIYVCWGGNISTQDRLEKIIKTAESVIGKRQNKFDTYYQKRLTNKLTDSLLDDTHPLKTDFDNKIIPRNGQHDMLGHLCIQI